MPLEEDDTHWISDPWFLKQKYMDRTSYPVPEYKYRYIYEEMLRVTGSVEIRHFYPNNRVGPNINYSQCFISKVYTMIDWGTDPMKPRKLRIQHDPQKEYSFNFWDYQNAWRYTFLYENEKRKHSWFIRIQEDFFTNTKEVPRWFLRWWKIFGPPLSLFPSPIPDLYDQWIELHPRFSDLNIKVFDGEPQFYFWAEFHIPWIWKWGLSINPDDMGIPNLFRTYHFQWWQKIEIPELISKINKVISANKQKHVAETPDPLDSKSNYIAQLKLSLKRRHPSLSNDQLMIKCLEYLQKDFSSTFEGPYREHMSLDSQSLHSEDDVVLAGESQNPDDDPPPSTEDIIGAAIDMIRRTNDKGKGPSI